MTTDSETDVAAAIADLPFQIAALGATFNADVQRRTREIYRPLHQALTPTDRLSVASDVAYGPDPLHRLDVYRPGGRDRPVFIFLHGGGFVSGDKVDDDLFYANIGHCFAQAGVMCVVANFRLSPAHPWPAGCEDVAAIVAWTRGFAEAYGGRPDRIFLAGHSSGAVHAAGYIFDGRFHPGDGSGLQGGVLMSGGYKVVAAGMAPNRRSYFGDDETQYPDRSPLSHISESRLPLLIAAAEFDPPHMIAPAFELAQAVTLRDGGSPRFLWLQGHNHISYIYSLGTAQSAFAAAVIDFIAAH